MLLSKQSNFRPNLVTTLHRYLNRALRGERQLSFTSFTLQIVVKLGTQ